MNRTIALLSLTLAFGCKSAPPPKKTAVAVCSAKRPVTKTNRFRPMRADDWYNLLVDRGVDGAPADCTGEALVWPAELDQGCMESSEPGEQLPAQPFKEEDVTVQRIDESTKLVWVVTGRFSNGDGIGPVALVIEGDQTMDVDVLGTLRARARRPRLKLYTIGKTEILTAEGEACEREDDPASCRRSMSLMRHEGNRFVPLRIHARNGMCLGPAVIHLARQKVVPAPESGWSRRLELHSAFLAQPQRLVVTEQVVVSDFDPTRPGVPPRPVRRADAEILYWFGKEGRFLASDASLWSRILEQIAKEKAGP